MIRLDRSEFEQLVNEVLENLPTDFARHIGNVEVVIRDEPGPEIRNRFPRGILLGLYQGTPLTQDSSFRTFSMPNRIELYQANIERICRSRSDIRAQVRKTLLHEIGHHFGMDEEDLRQAGYD